MDYSPFDRLSRDELVAKARSHGIERPELMTRVELSDELVRRSETDPVAQKRARGWLGAARDLVASVVESGLNLPDAAALIRGERSELELKGPAPVATVTLAEIYATQGHVDRALGMLDEVLGSEPEHAAARRLLERLRSEENTGSESARRAPGPELSRAAVPAGFENASPEPDSVLEPSAEPEAVLLEPERPAQEPEPELVLPAPAPEPERAAPSASSAPAERSSPSVLVLRTRSPHPIVCWELSAEEPRPIEGRLELQCVGFSAGTIGAQRRDVVVELPSRRGGEILSAFDARTIVRVALGVRTPQGFSPIAIGSEVLLRDGDVEVTFRPPLDAARAPSAAERALISDFAG